MKKILLISDFLSLFQQISPDFALEGERKIRSDMLCTDLERQRFLAAEWFTRSLCRGAFGTGNDQILGSAAQKPCFSHHHHVSFSRSYCADSLLIAAEDHAQIGADCEIIKSADDAVMRYFFTWNEQAFVKNARRPDAAFTLIWTRKESYVKCIGAGLQFPWNLLDVTPGQDFPPSPQTDHVRDHWITSYLADNMVLSICSTRSDGFPSVIQEWSPDEKDNRRLF